MKVFGLGLHKTGTTTLLECLQLLGLDVCPKVKSYAVREITASGEYTAAIAMAYQHEAFADSPWNYIGMHRILDSLFPSAKFILTKRDENAWFDSLSRWVTTHGSAEWIDMIASLGRGFDVTDRGSMVKAYADYNWEVQQFFCGSNRLSPGGRILVVDWESGDGWREVCRFLDIEAPPETYEFPHMLRYDEETDSYIDSSPATSAHASKGEPG